MEGDYHTRPHRGTEGRSPLEQWALSAEQVRYPDPGLDLEELFLFEARRRVMKDRTATVLDAYANTAVKRQRYTDRIRPEEPVEEPPALALGHAPAEGEKIMYQRHFALTRLPFQTPAQTDELFESASRRDAEARLGHLIELRGMGC